MWLERPDLLLHVAGSGAQWPCGGQPGAASNCKRQLRAEPWVLRGPHLAGSCEALCPAGAWCWALVLWGGGIGLRACGVKASAGPCHSCALSRPGCAVVTGRIAGGNWIRVGKENGKRASV